MRLSSRAGYAPTPSAQDLGEAEDLAVDRAGGARASGARLREAGINWNLAPVVDVALNPDNPAVVALGRTYSSDPVEVTAHARAFIRGMHAAGVLTALKHFPGHGSSLADSHHGFTDVTDTANLDLELYPFRALIADGLADAVMPAHVFNRHLDAWHPASLSWHTDPAAPARPARLQGRGGVRRSPHGRHHPALRARGRGPARARRGGGRPARLREHRAARRRGRRRGW